MDSLLKTLYDGHVVETINNVDKLIEKGEVAYKAFIEGLNNSDQLYREECAFALSLMADERSVPHLAKLVTDQSYTVRQWVARALGNIGTSDCKAPLLTLAEDSVGDAEEREIVRKFALEALRKIQLG